MPIGQLPITQKTMAARIFQADIDKQGGQQTPQYNIHIPPLYLPFTINGLTAKAATPPDDNLFQNH